jgi:flavin-binding protein dodecin
MVLAGWSGGPRTTIMAPLKRKEGVMPESVYKVIELVGTSEESWEKAAQAAVKMASASLRDLRIAEVKELDLQLEDGQVRAYRAKVKVSFKYHGGE